MKNKINIEINLSIDPSTDEKEASSMLEQASDEFQKKLIMMYDDFLVIRKEYLDHEAEVFKRYCNTPCWRYKA